MSTELFTQADLEQMAELGITEDEARRQLAILARGQRWATLVRPCTVGDGIVQLDPQDQERFISRWQAGADEGRISAFVPASGAATRMFAFLQRIRNEVDEVTLDTAAEICGRASGDFREFRVFVRVTGGVCLFGTPG